MDSFKKKYCHADDKFQFVLELADLYRSEATYDDCIKALREIEKVEQHNFHLMQLRLGRLFMQRTRSKRSKNELFGELYSLETTLPTIPKAQYLIRLVRGALILMRSRDHNLAKSILEPLRDELQETDQHFLFGVTSKLLGTAFMMIGDRTESEKSFQYALGNFSRYGNRIWHTLTLNDYAVLQKKICAYSVAHKLLKQVLKVTAQTGISSVNVSAYNNLGIINLRTGDWDKARQSFALAKKYLGEVAKDRDGDYDAVKRSCEINEEHLLVLSREFADAEKRLVALLNRYGTEHETLRMRVLVYEFLSDICLENKRLKDAEEYLNKAVKLALDNYSKSDIMTEVRSRLSRLQMRRGNYAAAKREALDCIMLSNKNADVYERAVALRLLGECYGSNNERRKANSCFKASIGLLRDINANYELMRSCLVYGSFLISERLRESETYVREAQKIARKLGIRYFVAQADLIYARIEIAGENHMAARSRLKMAEESILNTKGNDKRYLNKELSRIRQQLNSKIVECSTSGAKVLKSIGKMYEEARFPLEDLKSDMAYQVAQSIGADSLFIIKRRGRGYDVPLTYNIPVNEAKEIVRRSDRNLKRPILGLEGGPGMLRIEDSRLLICVPSANESGYVICASVQNGNSITPKQFEFLIAGADVIERLAIEDKKSREQPDNGFVLDDVGKYMTHPKGFFKSILTISRDMIRLIRVAERVSLSNEAVLLEGETGVGKELFAKAIHENSDRRRKPLVTVNAGGMPVNLLESQLFGHVKGAFTDAVRDRVGLIEDADGGTIFMDEVGEMGPELQVKLLRLLENGEYRRLGENKLRMVNVRVISATNRNLLEEVDRGNFRRDLYYRLGTVKLQIPPLRFRHRDIKLLVRQFLYQCAVRNEAVERYYEIEEKAMEALEVYDWPGNVRELQNEIRRIVALIGNENVIKFGMLSPSIKDYLRSKSRRDGLLERSVEHFERRLILNALYKNDWNRLRTAEELGVPRTTLLAKMRRLNVAAR
jgi:DNA-binding NtrC family response regulator